MNGSELYVQRRANDLRKEEAPLDSEANELINSNPGLQRQSEE